MMDDQQVRRIRTRMDTLVLKQRKKRPEGDIFGAVVAELLYERRLQQNVVAANVGISRSSLQKICIGEMNASIEMKSRILASLDAHKLMGKNAQETYLQEVAFQNGFPNYKSLCAAAEPVPRDDPKYLDALAQRHGLESRTEQVKIYGQERQTRPLNQIFSAVLEYTLQAEGIEQKELAEYAGRTPNIVGNWIQGISLPGEDISDLVLAVIGLGHLSMDVDVLLKHEEQVCEELGIFGSLRDFLDDKMHGKHDRIARRLGYESHEAYLKSRGKKDV